MSQAQPVIGVLVASTRPQRIGLQLGQQVAQFAQEHSEFAVQIIDLAQVNLPFLDEPRMPSLGDYVHEHTRAWSRTISSLDALIIVTPQYNAGYPAPLKNAIDTIYAEWAGKPVLILSYGYHGGVMGAQQLAAVLKHVKTDLVEPSVALTTGEDQRNPDTSLRDPAALVNAHSAELETALKSLAAAVSE